MRSKNDILKMWFLWKMIFKKCEFCKTWEFENVNCVKMRFSNCEFLDKMCILATVWMLWKIAQKIVECSETNNIDLLLHRLHTWDFINFFKQGPNGLLLLSRYGKICMHKFPTFFNDNFSTKKKIKEAHENDIKKLIVFFFFVPRNEKIRGRTSSQAKIDQETTLCIIIYSRKKRSIIHAQAFRVSLFHAYYHP